MYKRQAKKIVVLSGSDVTKQPSHISGVLSCNLPFPRNSSSPEFQELVDKVYYLISSQLHVPLFATADMPILPNVEIDELIGLLLSMDCYKEGDIELADLSEYMDIEIDTIMEVIYCLSLLGFAEVKEGNTHITPLGRKLLQEDTAGRKFIFAQSMIQNIPFTPVLLKTLQDLDSISYRDALQILEERFYYKKDSLAFMNIFLKWAIYADLILYNVGKKLMTKGQIGYEV